MKQIINNRLLALRKVMKAREITAVVIPNGDPHNSEYMAAHWKKLEWISGFTGSAATLVISEEHAGLWTDSRYFIQAEQELSDSEFVLHRLGQGNDDTPLNWLLQNLQAQAQVSMTGDMWPKSTIAKYQSKLSEQDIFIVTDRDLVSEIWREQRPAIPSEALFSHPEKYAGRTVAQKLESVRQEMDKLSVDYHLLTTLDDIAWLTNLRGRDVDFNPVFLAYAIIGKHDAKLYIDTSKLDDKVRFHLKNYNIEVREYGQVDEDLSLLNSKILVNPKDCNYKLYNQIPQEIIVEGKTITRHLKTIKNEVECQHIEQMMVKDGLALVEAFYWLDQHIDSQKITEYDFAQKIAECRSRQVGYYGESFAAIVGYQANGALNHYRPLPDTALTLSREGILLCDSGGQYVDGTSDITRTMALGDPTEEQRTAFTLVLKGHIALDRMHFPNGTTGAQLDVIARQHLWNAGMNYGHGTGHGVGFFMNVHEPPQGFAPGQTSRALTALQPGMFTSNEPGYYEDGEYGIRIENLVLTQESPLEGFLCHHNVTLYPMDLNLVDVGLLTAEEIDWINDYHIKVYGALSPHLDDEVRVWFEKKCGLIDL